MKTSDRAPVERWKKSLAGSFEARPELLIPALQYVQQHAGYLPRAAMTAVAEYLNLTEAKVFGVASFYSLFHMKPGGRHQITVCRGTACHVRGSGRLLSDLVKQLGIQPGETTPDMLFSLGTVACLGSCALAPVVVTDRVYGRQTSASVRHLVETLRGSAGAGSADKAQSRTHRHRSTGRKSQPAAV